MLKPEIYSGSNIQPEFAPSKGKVFNGSFVFLQPDPFETAIDCSTFQLKSKNSSKSEGGENWKKMMAEDLGVEAKEAAVREVVKLLPLPELLQSIASIKADYIARQQVSTTTV